MGWCFISHRGDHARQVHLMVKKHASWMNQVGLWFSILVRQLLKRSSFVSVSDLRDRILGFIEYFNVTMAKPFKWTCLGKPLMI